MGSKYQFINAKNPGRSATCNCCMNKHSGVQNVTEWRLIVLLMLSPGGETPNTRDCLQLACGTGRTVRLPLIMDGAAATEDGRCDCHCGLAGTFPHTHTDHGWCDCGLTKPPKVLLKYGGQTNTHPRIVKKLHF